LEFAEDASETISSAMVDVESCNDRDLRKRGRKIQQVTGEGYEALKSLLSDHDTIPPLNSGLVKITSEKDGTTAWIFNDPEVILRFHQDGKECFCEVLFFCCKF